MCMNLIKAGHKVTVYNRTISKAAELVAAGASTAASPSALFDHADVVFAMVSDPAAALDVVFAPGGVLEGMKPGKAYIDASTGAAPRYPAGPPPRARRTPDGPPGGPRSGPRLLRPHR